jgi:hypothetical protein
MHAQCEQLLRLAELPNLTLRVMPLPHGAHLGMNSAFAVLGFPEADDPDIAYIGSRVGGPSRREVRRHVPPPLWTCPTHGGAQD